MTKEEQKKIDEVSKWLGPSFSGGKCMVCMFDVMLYDRYGQNGKATYEEAMTKSIEDHRNSKK